MGRQQALTAEPLSEVPAIQFEIHLTHQARQALASSGPPPLDTIADVRPLLERSRVVASVLEGPDLVLFFPLLEAPRRLSTWSRDLPPPASTLRSMIDALPHLTDLAAMLRRALDDDGAVRDDASRHLGKLRRDIRASRARITRDLERMLEAREAEQFLADRYVTVRHGRHVLPVRVEARSRVPGIVHDRSQSGQTLFIEPAATVEANNELAELIRDEEQEVRRILTDLTAAVRARIEDVSALVDALGTLDWVFARAHAAERMHATAPIVDRARSVALRHARHPLLLAQSWDDPTRAVVPIDLELSRERPLLVITGPNAGGKTIALKTLALLALMAQVGCHVPAAEGSYLPVFRRVYAIIGDDQSVAENLSTFSAFVRQIQTVLRETDDESLVLLDELGAGTDPDEGAALAQAILEELGARGALVAATTHLEPLKTFAATHPQARNASVEFDAAELAPTFRLTYDQPGPSYALAIAARLGVTPELIARAQSYRSQHAARANELLARLTAATRDQDERAHALAQLESETATRLAAAREAEESAARRAREIVDRAKVDAATLVTDIRRVVAEESERLKAAERTRRGLEESRRRLREVARRTTPDQEPMAESPDLLPGMAVTAAPGLRGELVGIAGGTATVRAGSVTVRVPVHAVRPLSTGRTVPGGDAITVPAKRDIPPELRLLGRRADEAQSLIDQYLDDAFLAGLRTVRLVHGKGTGRLRKMVRDFLSEHPLVESFRDGEPSEGGTGATVAALRVS